MGIMLGMYLLLFRVGGYAQAPFPALSAGELQHELKHLQVLGSVLYIAAHPDDENTRMISYLARAKGYRTAYLALTRGDGGQNLIGDEKSELLGVLRTQELLAARRIDGGEQLFSRAYDFGYSKTPEETLEIWDEEKVLADVVWAIRTYRPDVIITRFATPEKGGGGHGHHTSSAILAHQAFDLAGDPTKFPEQLEYVKPWQPKRLLWNNYWVFRRYEPTEEELKGILKINAGTYDPLLGKNYGEIASEARSMHRCQAFGTSKVRGDIIEYLEHEKGDRAEGDLFDGIDASWSRIEGGAEIGTLLSQAYEQFNPEAPQEILPLLSQAYQQLEQLDEPWAQVKLIALRKIMLYCAGVWLELDSTFPAIAQGDSAEISLNFIKRSDYPVTLEGISIPQAGYSATYDMDIPVNGKLNTRTFAIPTDQLPISQPYWLEKARKGGIFQVDKQTNIGLPENPAVVQGILQLSMDGTSVRLPLPVIHKYVDRSIGEIYRPFIIAPRVTVNLAEKVYVFANDEPQDITLQIKSFGTPSPTNIRFNAPADWKIEPAIIKMSFEDPGEERTASIQVTPPSYGTELDLSVTVETSPDMSEAARSYNLVDYDHIPAQAVFNPTTARLVRVDLQKRGSKIGYIMGSGDEVPKSLMQMGYQVDLLGDDQITADNLEQYDAVVAGIRAYNRNKRMPYLQEEIFTYVEKGGTYIVQYNTTYDLSTRQPAPYPITLSRDRVTKEDAEATFLVPDHPVLNQPNKLTQADFEGWNQERGLYFPREWDDQFVPILSWHDPGEEPLEGGLLIAPHGEGYFAYTGISFFRHLPAGIPGSYRLFANLVSLRRADR